MILLLAESYKIVQRDSIPRPLMSAFNQEMKSYTSQVITQIEQK